MHFVRTCGIISKSPRERQTKYPGVAKFGIALEWGSRGLEFESRHSDHKTERVKALSVLFFIQEPSFHLRFVASILGEGEDCATRTGTVPRSAGHFRNPPRLPSGAEGAPPADPQYQNPLEAAGAETLPVGGQLAADPGKAAWTGQPEVGAAVEAADSGREHSRVVVPDPASGFCGKYRPAGEYSDCTCSHLPPGLCPSPRRNTEASPAILDARIARSSFPTRQGLR